MNKSELIFNNSWSLTESKYNLSTEAIVASLMTTGNGYIGVRASLEEYGSLQIQGTYIRGLCDKIVELRLPYCDNMYMKKYYVNEDKLKKFSMQESIINIIDFLLLRFEINGQTFYPWEGNLISWKRTLDIKHGVLSRIVVWETDKGEKTKFEFERFSSFDDDHIYCIKASATPINYSGKIKIVSGLDLRTKTNGQIITRPISSYSDGKDIYHENLAGNYYGFSCVTGVRSDFYAENSVSPIISNIQNEDFVSTVFEFSAQEGITYTVEKKVYIIASIDTKENLKDVVKGKLHQLASKRYCELKEKSIRSYIELFNKLDIKIKGDFEADSAVRFANYHTLISVERNDCVHSLSAKGLTGEAYNNFVWWDSEVYQSPVFMQTIPEAARNTLIYRYNRLDKAKELAIAQGMKGARFPFTSCVTGEETVWSDVRHPFMQIHVISDIGLGILKYYKCTADVDFMQNYGFEMLIEICRYWVSRVKWIEKNKRYEILCVTGTDEHHPYVDNNAYTNYSVNIVLKETLRLLDELAEVAGDAVVKTRLEKKELSEFSTVSNNLYLPMEKTKMIPQFDGYFDLSKELEIEGGSSAKNFQMKFSGLYNKSQVIKQPDVMLLFSYMDLDFGETAYARNWDYYQARCESSSSLSYPVHSICSSDMNQPESAYKYLLKSARLDIDDDHNCAKDGMHSACAAGAWLSVVRGIAGMKIHENIVTFDPHFIPWWDEVRYSAIWHGQRFKVILNDENIKVTANDKNTMTLPISICGKNHDIKPGRNVTEAIIHK